MFCFCTRLWCSCWVLVHVGIKLPMSTNGLHLWWWSPVSLHCSDLKKFYTPPCVSLQVLSWWDVLWSDVVVADLFGRHSTNYIADILSYIQRCSSSSFPQDALKTGVQFSISLRSSQSGMEHWFCVRPGHILQYTSPYIAQTAWTYPCPPYAA